MGMACLSKPLASILQRRFGVLVHPHPTSAVSKDFSRTPAPTSTIELSVVVTHTMNPPQHPREHPSTLSPPRENLKLDTGRLKTVDSGRAPSNGTAGGLHTNSNSFLQRAKSPRGSKISLAFGGGRAPSEAASDTGSVIGLMSGFYALASLTAYETNLIPDIWKSCLADNKYYCEHVLDRLFNRHPEIESMFEGGVFSCPYAGGGKSSNNLAPSNSNTSDLNTSTNGNNNAGIRQSLKRKAKHLWAFLHSLIITHELDYDRMLGECERLGRAHATYFYEKGLQSCHWDALAYCIVQEYKKTQMNCDMNTDEKELQLLAWTHFASAVVAAIKEAFEDEVHAVPVAPNTPNGEITYRF